MTTSNRLCSRRHVIKSSSFALGGVAAACLLKEDGLFAAESQDPVKPELEELAYDLSPKPAPHAGQAKAMISMFMLGGPSQIDLFDPKPELIKRHGQNFPGSVKWDNPAQASREIMAPGWKFHHHGECGMELSELLPHLGGRRRRDHSHPLDAHRRQQPLAFEYGAEHGRACTRPTRPRQLDSQRAW